MKCKYCGQELRSLGQSLRSIYGNRCKANSNGSHVALCDGTHCVYCGEETRTMGQILRTKYGDRCPASPTKKHLLQD